MNESWKRQILLNIVRLRYLAPPSFVDVGQIVAGYSLESGVSVSGQWAELGHGDRFAGVGGHATFTDRPTITYQPLTGNRFVRGLMSPLPPESLFYTIESGWPADVLLQIGLSSINGLRNESLTIDGRQPTDPGFTRATELFRSIQKAGGVGMRIVRDKEQRETKLITFHAAGLSPEALGSLAECRRLLGLAPDAHEVRLVFGPKAENDRKLAVQTRLLLHILGQFAVRTEVPPEHVREGRVAKGWDYAANPTSKPQIRCTAEQPSSAFVSIRYRDHWFWVDDRDLYAKRNFFLILMLFTLSDTAGKEAMPLITIPAQ